MLLPPLLFLLLAPDTTPEDSSPPASAAAVLARAVAAHGGAAALGKLRCCHVAEAGTIFRGKERVPLESETWECPGRLKLRQQQTEATPEGPKRTVFLQVVDGDRGWGQTVGEKPVPLSPPMIAELRAYLESPRLARLNDLTEKNGWTLTLLRPQRLDGQLAHGVRLEGKDQPATTLWFAAKSGLLVKSQTEFRDATTGRTLEQEIYFSDFQPVDGVMYPHAQTVFVGGNRVQEMKVTRLSFPKSLPDSEFAAPNP